MRKRNATVFTTVKHSCSRKYFFKKKPINPKKAILKTFAGVILACCQCSFSYSYYAHVNGPSHTCPDSELTYTYEDNMPQGRVRFTITNGKIFNLVSNTWVTQWEFTQSDHPDWNEYYPFTIKWDNLPLGTIGTVNVRVCQGWCVEGNRQVTFGATPGTPLIAGNTYILNCQSQQQPYYVNNVPENWQVASWGFTSYIQQVGTNYNQIMVAGTNGTYNGMQTLTANLEFVTDGNSCATQSITKNIWLGKPAPLAKSIDGFPYSSGYMICPGNHWVGMTWDGFVTSTSWSVTPGIYYSANNNECDFTLPSSGYSSVAITVNASNACGTSYNSSYYLTKKSFGCGSFFVSAYPNPADTELNIQTSEVIETNGQKKEIVADEILLFNKSRAKVLHEKPNSGTTKIPTLSIPPGEYFLHVKFGNEIIKKHIIIKK